MSWTNTQRNKDVNITSKRRFDVIITSLLRCVFAGCICQCLCSVGFTTIMDGVPTATDFKVQFVLEIRWRLSAIDTSRHLAFNTTMCRMTNATCKWDVTQIHLEESSPLCDPHWCFNCLLFKICWLILIFVAILLLLIIIIKHNRSNSCMTPVGVNDVNICHCFASNSGYGRGIIRGISPFLNYFNMIIAHRGCMGHLVSSIVPNCIDNDVAHIANILII